MRIQQKYFIPFILIIAAFCLAAIVFFNVRSFSGQHERLAEQIGDGHLLYGHGFGDYFSDDRIAPLNFEGQNVLVLFWATWSARSIRARDALLDIVAENQSDTVIILAAVKDDMQYLAEHRDIAADLVYIVNGTEFYQENRIPGLPSLIGFGADGSVYGIRHGFTKADDYHFLDGMLSSGVAE